MSGLRPVDSRDSTMLPAVYRRTDIMRPSDVNARQSTRGGLDLQFVAPDGKAQESTYSRSGSKAPPVAGAMHHLRKGMIIDVWV